MQCHHETSVRRIGDMGGTGSPIRAVAVLDED
jgi:hypothetical protein